ncbi:cytochrome b ascorbate-dependent protein 3-like [Sitophilus oryzae]|uniref:Cytochrome b ascorbate-dependent protein 3-like n=1 Tax=Sitophilus oryzae TaxID=7048 RepID=A0A6J2YAL4_SITOR|nr:cytochrome b ascorbate-dependent protein 3-like [Sitophilus oryzae]
MTAPSKVVLKHYARVTVFGLLACSKLLFWIYFYQGGFAWNSNLALKANWHPFLMTFGMVFLYSQAMVVFRTAHGVLDRKVLIAIHVGIHLVAFIISVIGLSVIIDVFRQYGTSQFKSVHSILGLFAIFLTGFLVVIQHQPILSKYFHMVMASLTLLAASIAVTSGLAVAGNYSLYVYIASRSASISSSSEWRNDRAHRESIQSGEKEPAHFHSSFPDIDC